MSSISIPVGSLSVRFDDAAVADFFDQQVDAGRCPTEFARLWLHTHPASSAEPSGTDEATFGRCFGGADWSVMFVLARDGQTYARLRFAMALAVASGKLWHDGRITAPAARKAAKTSDSRM